MTSQRAKAYGRVMKTLADLSAAKLHAAEEDTLREAADSLFFCEDLSEDAGARQALAKAGGLRVRLEDAERLTAEALDRLLFDIQACGPAGAGLPRIEAAPAFL